MVLNFSMVLAVFRDKQRVVQEKKARLLEGVHQLFAAARWPHLRWVFVAGFAFAYGWSFFNEFIPVLLNNRYSFTPDKVGSYFAWGGIWYALSALFLSLRWIQKLPPEKTICYVLIACAISMLASGYAPSAQAIWWMVPMIMLCLAYIWPSTTTIVSNRASEEHQGEVLGIYQAIQGFAMGVSPLMVGSAIGVYPPLTAIGGAIAMIIAAYSFWRDGRRAVAPVVD
jgi:DHA1 family tetracycline resistance protein-like MFS transporter